MTRGYGLIDLMVGLVLALLTVAGMLSTYKVLVGVSIPASRTAARESQATIAVITAQLELQQAGFGLDATEAVPKVQLLESDKKIVWSYKDDSTIKCAGLQLDADGIHLLVAKACAHANDGTALEKNRIATAEVLFEPTGADSGDVRAYSVSNAKFVLSNKPGCGQYGVAGSSSTSKLVELKDGTNVVFAHCLSNL